MTISVAVASCPVRLSLAGAMAGDLLALNPGTGRVRRAAGRRRPMRDQRPCEEFRSWREVVDDPLIRLVMKADHVSAAHLERLCAKLERRALARRREAAALGVATS